MARVLGTVNGRGHYSSFGSPSRTPAQRSVPAAPKRSLPTKVTVFRATNATYRAKAAALRGGAIQRPKV